MLAILIAPFTAQAAESEAAPPPRELAIQMGTPFHDSAILQRGMKLPVWGWSEPGSKVTVEFAGQKESALARKDGKWLLELPALEASFEPRAMTITDSTGKKEVLKDILVGEVWMCSGQSNMQFEVKETTAEWVLIPEIIARVEAGIEKMPVIREVKVTNKFSNLYPYPHAKAKWSSDWLDFSAVAFAFAYDIARETKVPVGIVNCSFSTTMIQAWVPREGFASGKDAYTKDIYKKVLESDYTSPEHQAAWEVFEDHVHAWGIESKERVRQGLKPKPRPEVPGIMQGERDPTWMANAKTVPMAPYAIRGAIWNQGYANMSEGLAYRNNLHSLIRGLRAIWSYPELPVYFHQFYASGGAKKTFALEDEASEMRLATWLAHRDIPNAAMASQIDITGGVHYRQKTVPGQRLARHALKHQYGVDLIADGPLYKDYTVEGNKLILHLDYAEGLCVRQGVTVKKGYATTEKIENGEDQVKLFYLAGEDLVWHQTRLRIIGEKIELTAPGVDAPRGVAYGRIMIGQKPAVYNAAELPLTPFVYYDHKLVVSDQWDLDYLAIPGYADSPELFPWPMDHFKVAGEVKDPISYGLQAEHEKLWLLSPQFAHNAVIQADVPTRIYGMALPNSVVCVKFAGFEESLTMGPDEEEWEMTLPAMEASAEPKLLHVSCTLNGKLAHERKITNVVVGDVWYVAANDLDVPSQDPGLPSRGGPAPVEAWKGRSPQLRMMMSMGRFKEDLPSRYKLNASGKPSSSYFPRWFPTSGLTKALAERIHAKTGKPVGIIVLNPKEGRKLENSIKAWTGFDHLSKVPEWQVHYEELRPLHDPSPASFVQNSRQYIELWRDYWNQLKNDPNFESKMMPEFPGQFEPETEATQIFNQSISAFSPGNFKAILCLSSEQFVDGHKGAALAKRVTAMANSWKDAFACGKEVIDPHFVYALPPGEPGPVPALAKGIRGKSTALEMSAWPGIEVRRIEGGLDSTPNQALLEALEAAVEEVYLSGSTCTIVSISSNPGRDRGSSDP